MAKDEGPLVDDLHYGNFLDGIRNRARTAADIEEGHMSTLLCHYGNVAYRTERKLKIDPKTEGFLNDDEANGYLERIEPGWCRTWYDGLRMFLECR